MFFQISNDPWIGHGRLKAWLSYLLLLMLLLFICFMVLTHMFTQTAHAGIWDSVATRPDDALKTFASGWFIGSSPFLAVSHDVFQWPKIPILLGFRKA